MLSELIVQSWANLRRQRTRSLLTMLGRLRHEFGVTFLFITHDLALAKYFAWEGRIAVMYVGSMVEVADSPRLVNDALHPYTQALLSAVPEADPELTRGKQRIPLEHLESQFGSGVGDAIRTLESEMEKRRRGEASELMDVLIGYRWEEFLGPFTRDPAEISW